MSLSTINSTIRLSTLRRYEDDDDDDDDGDDDDDDHGDNNEDGDSDRGRFYLYLHHHFLVYLAVRRPGPGCKTHYTYTIHRYTIYMLYFVLLHRTSKFAI